jgi:putative MATE family efflux protein
LQLSVFQEPLFADPGLSRVVLKRFTGLPFRIKTTDDRKETLKINKKYFFCICSCHIFITFVVRFFLNQTVRRRMKDFTKGSEAKQIFQFALPMLIGNVFMQLYQFADTVIVGRFLGKEALAAVGASTPVVFLTIALVIGIGIGSSIVISQYFGAKRYTRVTATCDTLFIFLFVAAIVITVVGIAFSESILRLMALPEEIVPMAKTYLQIYFSGSILLSGYNAVAAILRGVGDSKTPLYFLIVSSILNIVLDLLFIAVFGLGVAGAAWATVISQGVAFLLAVWYINRRNQVIRINLFRPKFDGEIFKQCIRMGLPAGFQQTFLAVGMLALMGIVNGFGTDVIAAYSAVNRIDTFAALPVMNFSAALTTFVGQNVGAGKFRRIGRGLRATLLMSLGTCLAINTALILGANPLINVFTTDPAVIAIGHKYLLILNAFYLIFAVMITINGLLRGAGAAVFPMIVTLLSLWLVRVPAAAWLSGKMGCEGIWWAMPFGWTVGMVAVLTYYFSGKWKRKAVVRGREWRAMAEG